MVIIFEKILYNSTKTGMFFGYYYMNFEVYFEIYFNLGCNFWRNFVFAALGY